MNKREEEIRVINENADSILQPDNRTLKYPWSKKPGFVCPACGSGTHSEAGTGMTKYLGSDGRERLKCHACGWSGDVLDYVGEKYGLTSLSEQIDKARELGAMSSDVATTPKSKQSAPKPAEDHDSEKKDFSAYFNSLKQGSDYLIGRGISFETQARLGILYDEERNVVVFPTSDNSYNTRRIIGNGTKCIAKGKRNLFNAGALDNEIVYVVEGEIDAASFEECGMPAVGLGGTGMVDLLADRVTVMNDKPALIIALDNDDAGRKATAKLEALLSENAYPHYKVVNLYGEEKDANDALMKDREAFTAAIKEAAAFMKSEVEYARESERISFNSLRQSNRQELFEDYVWRRRGQAVISTGFSNMDKALDGGLRDGLVILMAPPSVGKTTLTMQMAHNIASEGRDVIFVSYEDDERMLQAKIRSMYTAQFELEEYGTIGKCSLMHTELMDYNAYPGFSNNSRIILDKAESEQKKTGEHVIILQGTVSTSVEDIEKIVCDCIKINGRQGIDRKPVLIVDYLQKIAKPDQKDLREKINYCVGRLQEIAAREEMPIIAICSTARANYNGEKGMAGGKESGDIEYDAKVVLDLNYTKMKGYSDEEKAQLQPRRLALRVLKNKDGQKGDTVYLAYYSAYNYFVEASDNEIRAWRMAE